MSDFLVIDVEATCDDGGRVPRSESEIIEIGAVMVDPSFAVVGELQTFIKPVRHPRLTAFCTQLTSITQADVENAISFPEAMVLIGQFIGEKDPLFCSWGAYDKNQFAQDADYHGVALPFGDRHLNLKAEFSARRGDKKRYGMSAALRKVGLELIGTHHRGIDDARNIARLLPWIVGARGA